MIVLFWDSQRLVVIGFLTVLYIGIGAGALALARREAGGGASGRFQRRSKSCAKTGTISPGLMTGRACYRRESR